MDRRWGAEVVIEAVLDIVNEDIDLIHREIKRPSPQRFRCSASQCLLLSASWQERSSAVLDNGPWRPGRSVGAPWRVLDNSDKQRRCFPHVIIHSFSPTVMVSGLNDDVHCEILRNSSMQDSISYLKVFDQAYARLQDLKTVTRFLRRCTLTSHSG